MWKGEIFDMNVTLEDWTCVSNAVMGARRCVGKKNDFADQQQALEYLKRLIKQGHESVLEHVVYVFSVEGVSRALLQELARHRHISLSVKSTRWVLKDHAEFYVPDGLDESDRATFELCVLENLRQVEYFRTRYGNDVAKYLIPEAVTTDLLLTLNLREFRHIYRLRSSERALPEFRELVEEMVSELTTGQKELVTGCFA